MEHLSASQARDLVNRSYNAELFEVFEDIKIAALQGECELYISKPLKPTSITFLKFAGYKVKIHNGIAIQRDDLYYTITW